ncbi:Crp/Fnr family transcriptional regulator [Desulforamulus ruminis]|uniref:Cyclic nucleotide-binding protein n=1 Tax=Desulforamulus ruminis (strain ATCC 23193 / DSM 2154 / NCIMB 8452 / DL) TaxID=696281 RepID=F6DV69_DESRL|nr:Crp/Fnr family transcriptional regulator [Desulforamulus ruminis]AEG59135.1 cyclic nucleotide-binding protein [Desulforamulus ruminis DSM 2154]
MEKLKEYQDFFTEYSFTRKEMVFFPGKFPSSILLILKGKVRVYLSYPHGKEFTLTILSPGDVYSGHTRTFGQALEPVSMASIPMEVFKEMLQKMPNLVFGLVGVLGDALRGSMDVIESLVFEEADVRLISLLLEWARHNGKPVPRGVEIKLDFTREEIASMIGSSRQTLNNLFRNLMNEQLIEVQNKSILIKDLDRMRHILRERKGE